MVFLKDPVLYATDSFRPKLKKKDEKEVNPDHRQPDFKKNKNKKKMGIQFRK